MKSICRILFVPTLLAALAILICISGCNGNKDDDKKVQSKAEKISEYVMNEETDMRIFGYQLKPGGLEDGEKVPMVIYVHGGTVNSETLMKLSLAMQAKGIAGFPFECCGGDSSETAKSDGKEISPSHYSSRISDLSAIVEHVKTLPYVDTDKIYLVGESYGGLVISLYAANHNDEIAGIVLISSGIQDAVLGVGDHKGVIEKYVPEDPYAEILKFSKDVLCFCGSNDIACEAGEQQIAYYNEHRTQGTATYYELEGAGHGYNLYSIQQQLFVNETIYSMINK